MKIGVIMGGISSEREISLETGKEMVEALNKEKYEVLPIIIDDKREVLTKVQGIDFALLALHGEFGEDGTIQSVLQALNIPYSGSGILSSALCMDKAMTKRLLQSEGIKTAESVSIRKNGEIDVRVVNKFGYPVVVKPNHGGSSVGTYLAANEQEMLNYVIQSLQYDEEVIVEQYIKGIEITCPILEGDMLPIVAIQPKSNFFDYTSKYVEGGAEEYIIAFEEAIHSKIVRAALSCYKALKCEVYARIDMIIKEGEPYVLEVNTLPGMTKNSLFPKSAKGAGIAFGELLERIISGSLTKGLR